MGRSVENRDRGYAWVVVFAFFIVEILLDGVRFSFGLYFVEFLAEFKKSKADTAWIGGIMIGVYNLSGPVFAFIINKTGYRAASIIGTLLAVTGLLLSSVATQLFHLYLSYGVVQGFGHGLMFLAGTVAVSRYFLKARALAMGISFCGSGVGMFAISPLVRLLFETYSWRGSLLILAGLVLNCCVFSTLYRPLKGAEDSNCEAVDDVKDCQEPVENGTLVKAASECNSVEIQNPLLNTDNDSKLDVLAKGKTPDSSLVQRSFAEMRKEQLVLPGDEQNHRSNHSINMAMLSQSLLGSNSSFQNIIEKRYQSRNSNLNLQKSAITEAVDLIPVKRFQNSMIENMFPKELLTNVNFIIMMTATLSVGIPLFIPFSMLPDYALSAGATASQSAWLLSAIGVGGTVGRIGAGIISDIECVHRLTLNSVCYLVIGVTTIFAALLPMFEVLLAYSTLFGLFYGANYVVQPVVLIEYLSERYISEVFGIMMCVYGVSSFIGSPLAGWIFDVTGSYRSTFLLGGALFTLGGVINFFVLCTKQSATTRRQTSQQQGVLVESKVV